jgi:hypothetical protein
MNDLDVSIGLVISTVQTPMLVTHVLALTFLEGRDVSNGTTRKAQF